MTPGLPPPPFNALTNRYFVLRHGESRANLAKRIISNPQTGAKHYGLTPRGREQIALSVVRFSDRLDEATVLLSSDFLRAAESARIAAELLGCESPIFEPRLRERYFGQFDLQSDDHYPTVWVADCEDPSHQQNGVESAWQVTRRAVDLIIDLERRYQRQSLLLVSHGDVLQLLISAALGHAPNAHRQIPPLATGELRALEGAPAR